MCRSNAIHRRRMWMCRHLDGMVRRHLPARLWRQRDGDLRRELAAHLMRELAAHLMRELADAGLRHRVELAAHLMCLRCSDPVMWSRGEWTVSVRRSSVDRSDGEWNVGIGGGGVCRLGRR